LRTFSLTSPIPSFRLIDWRTGAPAVALRVMLEQEK
jgi:hypothetical protein